MEKPTELIKKIIDNLTIINNIEKGYSVLEKDIILHNLRTAYTHFLSISAEDGDSTPAFQLKEYQNNPEQEARIAQLESEIQQSNEEKALLQAQISQISIQYSQKVKDSAIEIENLKENNQTLQAKLEEKSVQVNTLMQGSQNYTEVLKEKEAIISQLKRELIEKENAIQELQLQIEEDNFFVDEEPATTEMPHTDDTNLLTFPEVAPMQPVVIQEEVKENIPLDIFDDEVEEVKNIEQPVEKTAQAADDRDLLFPAETPKMEVKPSQQSLFDTDEPLYKPEKKSLNDLLCNAREDISLGAKFQNARVKDLAKAISINDKFLFIRELFRNKGEEFSKSIQQLNACNTIDEAFDLMETMKKYYAWDTTAQAYLKLCDLVRRKFVD